MVAQTRLRKHSPPTPARTPPLFVSFPPITVTATAVTQPKLGKATKSPDRNRLGPKEFAPRGHKLFRSTGSCKATPAKRPTNSQPLLFFTFVLLRAFVVQKKTSLCALCGQFFHSCIFVKIRGSKNKLKQ